MKAQLYPIATIGHGQLYAMPKPAAEQLDADMADLRSRNIDKVVCLLESQESAFLGLQSEQIACVSAGLDYECLEIADFGVPDLKVLASLVHRLYEELCEGRNVVVHCRGGIGRTGLVCSCVLVLSGMDATAAMTLASVQRGCKVPETDVQSEMVMLFQRTIR